MGLMSFSEKMCVFVLNSYVKLGLLSLFHSLERFHFYGENRILPRVSGLQKEKCE